MSDPIEHDQATARRSQGTGSVPSRVPDRRYRALFEQSPLGLVLYAPDGCRPCTTTRRRRLVRPPGGRAGCAASSIR